MIELSPPKGQAPFKSFALHSGLTVFPDFANGGKVRVQDEADAAELEQEGWKRDAASRQAKATTTELLRKAYAGQMRRETGIIKSSFAAPASATSGLQPYDLEGIKQAAEAAQYRNRDPHAISNADIKHPRTEFGEVEHKEHGRLRISHELDGGRDWLGIHGINFEVADRDISDGLRLTAGNFNRAQDAETQRGQLAIVSSIVRQVLADNPWLDAKVREIKRRESVND